MSSAPFSFASQHRADGGVSPRQASLTAPLPDATLPHLRSTRHEKCGLGLQKSSVAGPLDFEQARVDGDDHCAEAHQHGPDRRAQDDTHSGKHSGG